MAWRVRIDIIALAVSLLAISISGWMLITTRASSTNQKAELRNAQLTAIAKSELASNRAQCFLRMSGKDTTALARLHTVLLTRNKTILDSHLDKMSASELASAEKLANDMIVGASEVEQQVTLTKQSMSSAQLALANQACPGGG
jgi:hypothetical protein